MEQLKDANWIQLVDYPDYAVEPDIGIIKSLSTGRIKVTRTKIPNNYLRVNLTRNNLHYTEYLHRLVYVAAHNIPLADIKGDIIQFLDGDATNTKISNLLLVNKEEFIQRKTSRRISDGHRRYHNVKDAAICVADELNAKNVETIATGIRRALRTGGKAYGRYWIDVAGE